MTQVYKWESYDNKKRYVYIYIKEFVIVKQVHCVNTPESHSC